MSNQPIFHPQQLQEPPRPFIDIQARWHDRGYLPHFETSAHLQMITYRLADSLPPAVVKTLTESLGAHEKSAAYRRAVENYADSGYGSCLLRHAKAAEIVRNVWLNRNERDYRLHAWVIMPNHVHVLVDVFPHSSLSNLVTSWKSISARQLHLLLGGDSHVWQAEYWDRFIRNGVHYERAVSYIYENPVNAGLVGNSEDWRWSSWGEGHLS